MTLEELHNILKATGYPVAYLHFKEPTDLPFIAYYVEDSPNFLADNKTYQKINDVTIELYTELKDENVEKKLESLLDENEIPYVSSEVYIESEQLFQKTYEVRLM